MQSSNVAAEPPVEPPEEETTPVRTRAQPKLFETASFLASPSISGTWRRPVIVLDNGPYQPFRVK